MEPTRLLCSWNSQAGILEWVTLPFLQGIFLTQESNPSLRHCGGILYCLSHQGSLTVNTVPVLSLFPWERESHLGHQLSAFKPGPLAA